MTGVNQVTGLPDIVLYIINNPTIKTHWTLISKMALCDDKEYDANEMLNIHQVGV
jgi:hypothetical protein